DRIPVDPSGADLMAGIRKRAIKDAGTERHRLKSDIRYDRLIVHLWKLRQRFGADVRTVRCATRVRTGPRESESRFVHEGRRQYGREIERQNLRMPDILPGKDSRPLR